MSSLSLLLRKANELLLQKHLSERLTITVVSTSEKEKQFLIDETLKKHGDNLTLVIINI